MKRVVSVLITTRNNEATIGQLLVSVNKQSYPRGLIEIVVVDNKSRDLTVAISKKYTKLVFDKGPERSAQRNWAAKKSRGEYLLVLDSDMVLSSNVIKEGVELFEKSGHFGCLVIPEKSFGIGFWAKVKAFEREINRGESYFEAARFFPRKIFEKYGGYDEDITGSEDWDLPGRIAKNYPVGRLKSYVEHNEGQTSLLDLASKKYYYALTVHKYLRKNKISIISAQTVYLLRRGFYKQWRKLLASPILTIGLMVMLFTETLYGGLGYLKGRFRL